MTESYGLEWCWFLWYNYTGKRLWLDTFKIYIYTRSPKEYFQTPGKRSSDDILDVHIKSLLNVTKMKWIGLYPFWPSCDRPSMLSCIEIHCHHSSGMKSGTRHVKLTAPLNCVTFLFSLVCSNAIVSLWMCSPVKSLLFRFYCIRLTSGVMTFPSKVKGLRPNVSKHRSPGRWWAAFQGLCFKKWCCQ